MFAHVSLFWSLVALLTDWVMFVLWTGHNHANGWPVLDHTKIQVWPSVWAELCHCCFDVCLRISVHVPGSGLVSEAHFIATSGKNLQDVHCSRMAVLHSSTLECLQGITSKSFWNDSDMLPVVSVNFSITFAFNCTCCVFHLSLWVFVIYYFFLFTSSLHFDHLVWRLHYQ
jgi:hypothetical protein